MKTSYLKAALATILLSLVLSESGLGTPVSTLDDIEFWAGTGANRAALLLDWDGASTGDQSLAWGYRWDGLATSEDMLRDVLAADTRLFAKISAVGLTGIGIYGAGYDLNNDSQFAIDDGTTFSANGIAVSGPADLAISVDPGDLYAEGWFLGFWHIGIATSNPFTDGSWASSGTGISNVLLVDSQWISLAFSSTFSFTAFAENPQAAEAPLAADFDSDDDVDGVDFLTWQQGFGITSGAILSAGDANDDNAVDSLDFQLWSTFFGSGTVGGALQSTVLTVPEPPCSICVLWIFFVFLLFGRCPCNRGAHAN